MSDQNPLSGTKITVNDPLTRSADLVGENLEKLKALLPDAFTEGKVDFDVLKQLLGGAVDEREERYGLNWHGKRLARQIALTPSTGTLRPCPEESVDWDTTQNLMIEGDNLEVLKLLQKSYAGKVKLIYIDPPYNTGKDFVYPDNFKDSIKNYHEITGDGSKVRSNPETSGRYHTDWLNMMYPRLWLARGLLCDDGVIAISIDDHEADNLTLVCNEIFGSDNFVGRIAVQLNPRGRHLDRFIAKTHEYVLIYAKDPEEDPVMAIAKGERMSAEYRKEDERGRYRDIELRNRNPAFNRATRPNLYYPIFVHPESGEVALSRSEKHSIEVLPRNSEGADSCWTWGRDKLAKDHKIVSARKVHDGGWRIYRRDYLVSEDGTVAKTLTKSIWIDKEINNDVGKKAIQDLFGGNVFDFPKSPALIEKLLEIGASPGAIVMDFFAGSGVAGDAVFTRSATTADLGLRCILVQLPEPVENAKGYKTIAEITKERLRRAGAKIRRENPLFKGDTGFRVFKLDSSNIRAWDPNRDALAESLFDHTEHLVPGRTEQDVVFELLLKLGLDLTVPIVTRTLAGKAVHSIGDGALIISLADGLDRETVDELARGILAWRAELAPAVSTSFVFKDSGFTDDVAKSNLVETLRQGLDPSVIDSIRSI